MTGVKESVETDTEEHVEAAEGPDEEVETEEVEELDQEIVTEEDLNKDGSSEVPEKRSRSRKDSERSDTHVKNASHKSDQRPISEDKGEETTVKEINAGNTVRFINLIPIHFFISHYITPLCIPSSIAR